VAVPEDSLKLTNINVVDHRTLPTPGQIREELNPSHKAFGVVAEGRHTIQAILDGKDPRRFIVIGPCSVHDVEGAMEYAQRLKKLSDQVQDQLLLVMRVYFEKPRTTVGWKGLINDPHMDDSFDVESGIKIARRLLMDLAELGLPTATEALDPIVPQYISDLISWIAIGARTTESQTHRELASGLSTPVGFKNGTDGNIQVAINAMKSSLSPHSFIGVDSEGRIAVYKTKGNVYNHVVLRGGKEPNYDPASVAQCLALLKKEGLREKLMIDCSHGNSQKNHRNQPAVFLNVLDQMIAGNTALCSWMVESNLEEGNQEIPQDLRQLKYGVSVTDKCIDWTTTEQMILEAYQKLT
jgi:3-deoxy-7-phosphoheptulonate synthase